MASLPKNFPFPTLPGSVFIAVLVWICYTQARASYAAFDELWGWPALLAIPAGVFCFAPYWGTVFGIIGAIYIWGWQTSAAILFFAIPPVCGIFWNRLDRFFFPHLRRMERDIHRKVFGREKEDD